MNERIAPYTRIRGNFIGRLGFLGYDRDRGRPVAVTARQILKNRLFLRSSRELLGNVSVIDVAAQERKYGVDISELLVLAELRGDILFEQSQEGNGIPASLEVNGIHMDTDELLGDRLWLKLGADDYREVFVETVRGRFVMPHPKLDDSTLFTGAIGISSVDQKTLTAHGDAGTLAVTEDGLAVGVVVCGRDNMAFLAPLASFLEQFGDIVALTNQHMKLFQELPTETRISQTTKSVLSQEALAKKLRKMNQALQSNDDQTLHNIAAEIEDEVLS